MTIARHITRATTSKPILWTIAAVALVIAIFWPTAKSVVGIWSTSETFTHGYFVFPAFLWLVWRKRDSLVNVQAQPAWWVLLLVALFGACWLISGLVGIQVGEHAALALIIMSTIWASVGTAVATVILFPILFLFFLAPVGEELVPYLMELTADVTVWAIRASGIPIYREGLFFSLPSGNWSVVEACSGINYLISSISLGSLYAYMSYRNYKTRAIFMIIATILPIVANSVRAYIIVMLGHFSDNKIATGVDHLIYGWVFFGIVMFLLFSIGSLFQDGSELTDEKETRLNSADLGTGTGTNTIRSTTFRQHFPMLLGVMLAVGIWPTWITMINSRDAQPESTYRDSSKFLPQAVQSHQSIEPTAANWQPFMTGYDVRLDASYQPDDQTVSAMAFVYFTQRQGKEMINSANVLVKSQGEDWRSSGNGTKHIILSSGASLEVRESTLRSSEQTLRVWQWYQIDDTPTISKLEVKLLEMLGKLTLNKQLSITYILATEDTQIANEALTAAAQIVLADKLQNID